MKLNRRVTGGLAWAGLALIIGVPSAGALFPDRSADKAMVMDAKQPNAKPTKQVAAQPAKAVLPAKAVTPPAENKQNTVASVDPVKEFMSSGKSLPSYIRAGNGPAAAPAPAAPVLTQPPAAAAPAPAVEPKPVPPLAATLPPIVPAKAQPVTPTAPAVVAATPPAITEPAPPPAIATPTTTVLASVDPNKPVVAPVPMPASMRPKPQLAQPLPAVAQRSPSIEPFPTAVPGDSPVVVLDPVPQQDSPNAPIVTERDLAGWKSGTLADYLASKGLLSNSKPRPRAPVNYDQNGFFLSDGPNADRYYRDDTYVN